MLVSISPCRSTVHTDGIDFLSFVIIFSVALFSYSSAINSFSPVTSTLTLSNFQVRNEVTGILVEMCEGDESVREVVAECAGEFLRYLLQKSPPKELCSQHLGRPPPIKEWTEPTVKACLYLYLALLPLNQALIHE